MDWRHINGTLLRSANAIAGGDGGRNVLALRHDNGMKFIVVALIFCSILFACYIISFLVPLAFTHERLMFYAPPVDPENSAFAASSHSKDPGELIYNRKTKVLAESSGSVTPPPPAYSFFSVSPPRSGSGSLYPAPLTRFRTLADLRREKKSRNFFLPRKPPNKLAISKPMPYPELRGPFPAPYHFNKSDESRSTSSTVLRPGITSRSVSGITTLHLPAIILPSPLTHAHVYNHNRIEGGSRSARIGTKPGVDQSLTSSKVGLAF